MAVQNLIDHLQHTRVDTQIEHVFVNQTMTINEKNERKLHFGLGINHQV